MINQSGFTIIEWMIYFFLIVFVLTGLFHFATKTQQKLLSLSKKSGIVAHLCGAQDGLAQDIAVAPINLQAWDTLSKEQIAWTQKKKKICWNCEKKTLYRSEQVFDEKIKAWLKKKKIVVCRNVTSVFFDPNYRKVPWEKKPFLSSITCKLQQGSYMVERTVLLRNRIVA